MKAELYTKRRNYFGICIILVTIFICVTIVLTQKTHFKGECNIEDIETKARNLIPVSL